MIILTYDSILQAVVIERSDRLRVYCPKPQSMRRILRMTSQIGAWVYLPCFYPGLSKWAKVQL